MGQMLKIRILEKARKCSLKCMLLLVTTVLFLFKDAKACDVLIFIDHDKVSTICLEESGCVDGMKSFTVKKGFDICIEDHLNDRVVMHVSDIIWRVRYEREYYIREDKICLNTTSIACSKDRPPEGNTRDSRESFEAECRAQAVSNLSEVAKNQTFNVNTGYFLVSSSVWKMCACVNTYKLEEIGHLHTVLHQKTNPIPILEVEVKDALNNTQKITLSEHDQTFLLDVSKFKLKESGSIPFTVSSSLMQNWPRKSLLEYNGEFFYVDELSLRSYSERVSGDSMTTVQGKTEDTKSNAIPVLYKKLDAECAVVAVPDTMWSNCSCTCRKEINGIMMPLITSLQCTKLAKDKSFYSQPKKFTLPASGFSVVDTYDETIQDGGATFQYGHVVLGVGNNFKTMEGRCAVRHVGSYGCFSCDDSAHIAIQATNIEKGGLVPFVSNCSFDRHTIKCDFEPTKLILREKHDVCYIKLLTKKRSELTIHIKYINFHGLNGTSPRQLKCEQNFPKQGMVNTVVSTRFLVTLMGAVTACFLLTMVSILLFRFVQSRHGLPHRVAEEPTLLEEL